MPGSIKTVADQVGQSLSSGTEALGDAVLHMCAAIVSMTAGEAETNQLGVTRRETMKMHHALGVILDARQSQIAARLAALGRARALKITDYGEGCPCSYGKTNDAPTAERVGLALVS